MSAGGSGGRDAHCPACGGPRSAVFAADPVDREYFHRRSVPASFLRCLDCRSLYQDPWPDAEEVQSFYGPDYQNYTSCSVPLLSSLDAGYQRRQGAAFLRRHGAGAAVLDFGCGQGGFLRVLSELGCRRLAGFDFALYEELDEIEGVRFYDDLESIAASGERFDVIRMRHVIEHLTDPDQTLARLRALLAPGGRIVGQTPNAAHYTAAWMGRYWGPLHFPYHTILFSPEGLSRAAERWKLALVETAGALIPTGWALSFENALKRATGWKHRGRTPLYTLLMAASMPMAALDVVLSPRATANFDFALALP